MYAHDDRETDDPVSLDEAFAALGRAPRRRVLEALRKRDPDAEVTLAELAERSAGRGGRVDRVALFHDHLPHLDEAGFVDLDREANRVSRGPHFEAVGAVLSLLADHADELPHDWP